MFNKFVPLLYACTPHAAIRHIAVQCSSCWRWRRRRMPAAATCSPSQMAVGGAATALLLQHQTIKFICQLSVVRAGWPGPTAANVA